MNSPATTLTPSREAAIEAIVSAEGGSFEAPIGGGANEAVIDAATRIARVAERRLVVVTTPTLRAASKDLVVRHGGQRYDIMTPRAILDDPEHLDGAVVAVLVDLPSASTPTGAALQLVVDRSESLVFVEGPRNAELFAPRMKRDQLARTVAAAA